MKLWIAALSLLCTLSGCTPAHPRRIAPKQLTRLVNSGERFVVVFGSVKAIQNGVDVTSQAGGGGAQIRFGYEKGAMPLLDLPIPSGQRFYAVLRPPAGKSYLDKIDAQVRWLDSEYDPLTYMRLNDKPPYAFYLGEIEMTVADGERNRVKQVLSVKVFNESAKALEEFNKLYPLFKGELVLNSLLTARPGPPVQRTITR